MKTNKKKSIIVFGCLALLLLGTFVYAVSQNTKDGKSITTPFNYTIRPGTDEWRALDNVEERREACKVDLQVLDKMTTEALVETVIKYPLLVDMYAYNSIEEGLLHVGQYFQGVDVLSTRSDAIEELQAYVVKKELTSDDVEFIYVDTLITYIRGIE